VQTGAAHRQQLARDVGLANQPVRLRLGLGSPGRLERSAIQQRPGSGEDRLREAHGWPGRDLVAYLHRHLREGESTVRASEINHER
jgi:hypothetical protein